MVGFTINETDNVETHGMRLTHRNALAIRLRRNSCVSTFGQCVILSKRLSDYAE